MHADVGAGDAGMPDTESALRSVRSRRELIAVLLAAELYMPSSSVVEGGARASRLDDAAAARYPVIVEEGERLVPVFTTEAAVLAALPDPDRAYVVAPGTVLLAGWPPDAALYLNPGGPLSTKVPGERVAALREEVLHPETEPGSAGRAGASATPAASSRDAPAGAGSAPGTAAPPARRSWLERLGLRRRS